LKTIIRCQNCKAELHSSQRSLTCPQCSANNAEFYTFKVNNEKFSINSKENGIWRYKEALPEFTSKISLGEGNTSLRKAQNLFHDELELLLKIEGENPTGSFMDRVSPLMISDALDRNMKAVVCASDGNLGASISAYCASAGLKSICVIPKSTSPEKKIQMDAYGAETIVFGETIDDSLELAKKMADEKTYQATPEFNILTIEGAKTISFEIISQLIQENKELPWIDYIIVPLGSGRLLYSLWKGFKQSKEIGYLDKPLPKIIGVQLRGYDSITNAIKLGEDKPKKSVKEIHDKSLADAILARNSIFSVKAIESIRESNGTSISISEMEMIAAGKKLGQAEGVFAELSSATVIAAIEKLVNEDYFEKGAVVLALITASGLKTSQAYEKSSGRKKKVESFRNMGTKVEILRIIDSSESDFGYGIWKSLGQSLSLQAVYQHLKELLSSRHIVEIETNDRQKKYTTTEKGKRLIQKMKELEELLP